MEETATRQDQEDRAEEQEVKEALGLTKPTEEEQRELDQALDVIRQGESPVWLRTFPHPIHGDLEVRAKLPTAGAMTRHTVAMDQLAGDAGIVRSAASGMYLAAISAFDVLFDRILLDEIEQADPDNPDHTKTVKVYYDAETDISEHFPLDVWLAFSRYRGRLLGRLGDLKNSSAGTTGAESGESLPAPMASPSTTHA